MKAVVVTPYYHPKIGGLETYARQLNIALHELKQWEIVVITSNHAGKRTVAEKVDGLKVYRLSPALKFSNTPLNPLWPLKMRRIFKAEQPDVILVHTPVPSLADAARLAAPRKTPFVVVYHAATLLKGGSKVFDAIARAYQLYERLLFRRANLILAVSDYVAQQFPAPYRGKTRVVTNAVWERDIAPRKRPRHAEFLFIGSLDRTHAWKGLELIIQAMGRLKSRGSKATLAIMGDGNKRAAYQAQIKKLGLDKVVTFLGAQRGEAKEAALRRAMALVMYPTSANDAFPTVMLEAWARHVPVIAAAIGPIPSLVADGVDGIVVKPHNPAALAGALWSLVDSPAMQRQGLSDKAAARAKKFHTWEIQAQLVDTYVKELLR